MAEQDVSGEPEPGVPAHTVADLQRQIDALTETLEAHQRLFERLYATGVLSTEDGR